MVPVASHAKIDGRPMRDVLGKEKIDSIIARTNQAGAEVIGFKGSTFYAPSHAIALMTEAIVKDTKAVLPVSAYLQGEYGVSGIFSGVPVKLGKDGREDIVELPLDEEELSAFKKSCSILTGSAKELGLV
jgi:malate dehydrogenase